LISLGCTNSYTLPIPESPLTSFQPDARTPLSTLGEPQHTPFEDSAPAGGVLVGMRVFSGDRWGGVIQSLQPIYQIEDRYALGTRLGPETGIAEEVIARPGYAIGAIHIKQSLVFNGIQFVFYRYEDGKLIPGDDYRSKWFGINTGSEISVDSRERPLVGLKLTAEVDIHSLTPIAGENQ
jgi:hypothetical protein